MSDFIPRDILPDLWEEILRRHWTYLETEESMQKLEERKKLEGCLREFLCIVPHDRKFFLPETGHVLKKSIKEMDDFSAYKAMIGLESISQYANNLFTKPWRKEYRVIKMYSGFYQHEIKSNLIEAEKLFEAMGYRRLSDQLLVLDGPICPDQVTNVSRDAMAAYVECQIMKQIFSDLTSMQLSCSWVDIFNFRESHIGGPSQASKAIAYSIQEKRFRKEKSNSENNGYATIQHGAPPAVSCANCAHSYHTPSQPHIGNGCGLYSQPQPHYSTLPPPCSIHNQPASSLYMTPNNLQIAGMHCKQSAYSAMSHSKSLEHYAEHPMQSAPMAIPPAVPHRHSFDQSGGCNGGRGSQNFYDSPYDCVDAATLKYQNGCNFNAYSHPYNVSGNRYPLPYNISNQLNGQYGCPAGTQAGHYPHPSAATSSNGYIAGCGHKIQPNEQLYTDCNGFAKKQQQLEPLPSSCNYHNSSRNSKDFQNYRQRSFPPDQQLIDFEDRGTSTHDQIHHPHSQSQSNSFDYSDRGVNKGRSVTTGTSTAQNFSNQAPRDLYNSDEMDGNYLYSRRSNSKTREKYEKPSKRSEYEKMLNNKPHKIIIDGTGDSYDDSFEELVVDSSSSSKPVKNKNQDGVGSFESWDYVFQNLEKHGYSKDLGERGDLLVQSLDLDSMKINDIASDKRRSRNLETKTNRTQNEQSQSFKLKTFEKQTATATVRTNGKELASGGKTTDARNVTEKSILKQPQPQRQENGSVANRVQLKPIRSTLKNGAGAGANGGATANNNFESSASNTSRLATRVNVTNGQNGTSNGGTALTTGTNANEWSCRFCTFLNPDTKRICEMCCRSKDFNLDTTNAPTCV